MPTTPSTSPLLLDFLNRGLLPFVGRERERAILHAALRSAVEANSLRSTVLVGEGGVGKSRLVEAVTEEVEKGGGIVVVARLYPETASSLAAPLVDALWRAVSGSGLLRAEPERSSSGVAAALRRVARLRPTVVVLDDLHLLSNEGLGELRSLLDLLDEEPVALLGVLRPGDAPARAVLEPTLGLEMVLEGLESEALQPLWSALFPGADAGMVEHLHEVTGGNMLAVRSALRTALSAGALEADGRGERWKAQPERFAAAVERSIGLMAGGMTAHLSSQEIEAATKVATLGGIFARETAIALLDDPQVLEILVFKGVLAPALSPPPALDGVESHHSLYTFAHSLIHRALTEEITVDSTGLMRVLAEKRPLYTLDIVRFVVSAPFNPEWSVELMVGAIGRLINIARSLDSTADWHRSGELVSCALRLIQWGLGRWEEGWWKKTIYLLHYNNCMFRRRDNPVRTLPLVASMRRLTENPRTLEEASDRLVALRQEYRVSWEHTMVERLDLMQEIRDVVRRFPETAFQLEYGHILFGPLSIALRVGNRELVDEIEQEVEELKADPRCTEAMREEIHRNITLHLIHVIRTPEDVPRRRAMLRELEEVRSDPLFEQMRLAFMLELGEAQQVIDDYPGVARRLTEKGLLVSVGDIKARMLVAQWLAGEDSGSILQQLDEVLEQFSVGRTAALLVPTLGWHMVMIAMLGDRDIPELDVDPSIIRTSNMLDVARALHLFDRGEAAAALESLTAAYQRGFGTGREAILEMLAAEGDVSPELRASVLATLPAQVFSLGSFIDGATYLRLAVQCAPPDDAEWRNVLRGNVERLLDWCESMGLGGAMAQTLRRHEDLLPARERKRRRERCNELLERYRHTSSADEEGHLRVTMIGVITVARRGESPASVQGERSRTLLGLMTAAAMRRTPPEREEFWRIATGVDSPDELDRARRTMHQAVLRLREALGHDAVRTDGDLPSLDPSLVRVDLLELNRALGQVEEDLRAGFLLRVRPALLEILREVRNEVLFPTLYDEFFEAARQEFENRLRRSTVQTVRALMREEDYGAAEELLRAALVAIPEDEEMGDLLADALEGLDRPADAALARLRAEREA